MFTYVNNSYASNLVRKMVRECIKGKNNKDLYSTIWRIKTIASNWDPEYGTNLVWDDSLGRYVTTKKDINFFNIACQAMGNMYKVPEKVIKSWYYEIRPTMIVYDHENDQELFLMPSTKKVIEYLEALK